MSTVLAEKTVDNGGNVRFDISLKAFTEKEVCLLLEAIRNYPPWHVGYYGARDLLRSLQEAYEKARRGQ